MINIVNLRNMNNIKAWLEIETNVCVGRVNKFQQDSKWGNPFQLNKFSSRQQVVEQYKRYVLSNTHLIETVKEL